MSVKGNYPKNNSFNPRALKILAGKVSEFLLPLGLKIPSLKKLHF